jgi:hypothetical protein
MRIVKEKSAHKIDAIVALAFAVCGLSGAPSGEPALLAFVRIRNEKIMKEQEMEAKEIYNPVRINVRESPEEGPVENPMSGHRIEGETLSLAEIEFRRSLKN